MKLEIWWEGQPFCLKIQKREEDACTKTRKIIQIGWHFPFSMQTTYIKSSDGHQECD